MTNFYRMKKHLETAESEKVKNTKKNKITTMKFSINDIKVAMLGENCR